MYTLLILWVFKCADLVHRPYCRIPVQDTAVLCKVQLARGTLFYLPASTSRTVMKLSLLRNSQSRTYSCQCTVFNILVHSLAPFWDVGYAPDGNFVCGTFTSVVMHKLLCPKCHDFQCQGLDKNIYGMIEHLVHVAMCHESDYGSLSAYVRRLGYSYG